MWVKTFLGEQPPDPLSSALRLGAMSPGFFRLDPPQAVVNINTLGGGGAIFCSPCDLVTFSLLQCSTYSSLTQPPFRKKSRASKNGH